MVLKPSYFTRLTLDKAIQAQYAYGGSEVIRYRQIPAVSGFAPVMEYSGLPDNSQNLVGVVLNKQAAIVASRVPATPDSFNGEITNVSDPDSGFTMQLRKWYSPDAGKYFMSIGALWGASVGNGAAAVRIVSA